jgi:hypothetical protein
MFSDVSEAVQLFQVVQNLDLSSSPSTFFRHKTVETEVYALCSIRHVLFSKVKRALFFVDGA